MSFPGKAEEIRASALAEVEKLKADARQDISLMKLRAVRQAKKQQQKPSGTAAASDL